MKKGIDEFLSLEDDQATFNFIKSPHLTAELEQTISKVGIIGCGAIAEIITNFAAKGKLGVELQYFHDQNWTKAKHMAAKVNGVAVKNFKDMLNYVDLVVEAASPQAVVDLIPTVLKAGKHVMIMSLGALMDINFKDYLENLAQKHDSHIYLPSGALVGLDGIRSASIGKIKEVYMITRKSPSSFGIKTNQETVLFEGKASDAVVKFPTNINVAAALTIVCGMEAKVKIIADPSVKFNCHDIHVSGDFGDIKTSTRNQACDINTKTSLLAAYSAIKLLQSFKQNLKIGT